MQGSSRSLDGIRIHTYTILGRDDDTVYTCTFASTGNGTEVTHIGQTIQHDEQWILAFFEKERNQIFCLLVSNGRNISHYTLVVLTGNSVDAFYRYTLYRNQCSLQYGKQFFGKVALNVAFHQNFVDFLSGLNGFDDCTYTEYHFTFFCYHNDSLFNNAFALFKAASVIVAPLNILAISCILSS